MIACVHAQTVHINKPRQKHTHTHICRAAVFVGVFLFFIFYSYMIISSSFSPVLLHQELLVLLRKKGPSTEGVFRKLCNIKSMKDIREQLNSGGSVDMGELPVVLLVGLLKVRLHTERRSHFTCSAHTISVTTYVQIHD